KTKAHQERIKAYLLKNGESKSVDIAAEIGLSVARVRAIMGVMDEVVAHGNNKNRTYRLK
ncbi:MAG: AAA family ATPase, partial [Eubacteriales bacterium]|nr:AAA family ATPase [Eubacteriales bacterium]